MSSDARARVDQGWIIGPEYCDHGSDGRRCEDRDRRGPGPLIRTEHLTRRFGAIVAVDDVSFEVARGEIFAFLGPNG